LPAITAGAKARLEVQQVEPTPRGSAGLREGDVIINRDRPATSIDDLHKLLTELPVGIPSRSYFWREHRKLSAMVVRRIIRRFEAMADDDWKRL